MKHYVKITFILMLILPFINCTDQIQTKLLIIGSGPSGLTAGIYAGRAQLNPIILEGDHPGGHLVGTTFIENWPDHERILGVDLMDQIHDHAIASGAKIISESVSSIDLSQHPFKVISKEGTEYLCNALILAMGSSPRRLRCEGEADYWGKGIAACATCDGPLYKNKDVVVIGGGDSAMEYASFLAKFARNVTIIQLLDKLTASATMQARVLENPRIKIYYSHLVTKILGNGNRVTGITITHVGTKIATTLTTDGIFVAIGHTPNTSMVRGQISLDPTGHILVHDKVKTSVEGVFACGDIMDPGYKQAIVAAGLGCTASMAAERYLLETKQHKLRFNTRAIEIKDKQ